MTGKTLEKLKILAAAAKYDVSCSSSGVSRGGNGGLGSCAGFGLCHSFTADGRCVSLLKILLSNHCRYNCAYCVNRAGNDAPRASFESAELAELVMEFYRRNFIEGLFLSSGVARDPDYSMETMLRVLTLLRGRHNFNGYIHMKCLPGASRELLYQAGLYADRLSVNIEIPSEHNLKRLAPDKDYQSIYTPMSIIRGAMEEHQAGRPGGRAGPPARAFAPAGQSTQMIIGASNERDKDILRLSSMLYRGAGLKRVYYSAFVPVNKGDPRLPALQRPPLLREHRLYQADWLLRFYHFEAEEIADEANPELELELDPKSAWALRHPEFFPLDVNKAEYAALLRVPGLGVTTAKRVIEARRCRRLETEHLARLGVVMKRARFFLSGRQANVQSLGPAKTRALLLGKNAARPPDAYKFSLL